jgi:hypothetical protein
MAQRLTCLLGHQWDAPARSETTTDVYDPTCPQCGAKPLEPTTAVSAVPPRGAGEPATPGRHRLFWVLAVVAILGGMSLLIAAPFVFLNPRSSRLNYSKNVTVPALDFERIKFNEPRVERAMVTVKSPGAPVSAFLVVDGDEEAGQATWDLLHGQMPTNAVGSKENTEEATFEIAPGKKRFVLFLVSTGRGAEVSVFARGR